MTLHLPLMFLTFKINFHNSHCFGILPNMTKTLAYSFFSQFIQLLHFPLYINF